VPVLLQAPWLVALQILPWPPSASDRPGPVLALTAIALLGQYVVAILVSGMLRFRTQSVFNTPLETRPAPATECYARSLRRLPWLIVTEVVRNFAIVFAS